MKKLLIVSIACLFVVGLSATAKAVPLPPSGVVPGIIAVADLSFAYGPTALVASEIGVPFTGLDTFLNARFTGTLSQWVYSDPTGMLFEYQFTNNGGSPDAIGRLSTTDFSGFFTDVAHSGSGIAPDLLLRNSGAGDSISFDFFSGVPAGATSDLLWIQTNAPGYTLGSTVLQDGGNTRVQTWAPTATPEPATMAMFGMGAFGLFGLRKRKQA